MHKFKLLFFLVFFHLKLVLGNTIDTSRAYIEIKFILYPEFNIGGGSNEKTYIDYVKRPLDCISLKTKGFENNLLFFKIVVNQIIVIDTMILANNRKEIRQYNVFSCPDDNCDYIVGYDFNTGQIFKLKGVKNNDFTHLYFLLTNERVFRKKTIKKFLEKYSVEGLDFKCLIDNLRERKKDKHCLKYYTKSEIINY